MRTLTFNRIIGNGAMGTVYHATLRVPRGFSRQCAVKVMKVTSPDQEHFRARTRDEARLLGMLQDEQILGVSELVQVDGRDCVVMEFVEGVDLAELVKVRTVPPRALAELGAEVAGTLHRAHVATNPLTAEPLKVIHRDVKPANVMVTSRGGMRLLDFGVARAAFSSRESQTQGLVLGTLNYFPPEILAGGEPTPAVDIYGLGLTLWECATGKDWGSPQVHKHRFERRVEQRLAEISDEYQAMVSILRQILQWDPLLRPEGGEVEKALLAAADRSSGEGLRTWSREVVPPILVKREGDAPHDDLVGKTMPLEGSGEDDAPPESSDKLKPSPTPIGRGAGSPAETQTFNDLAPPAAVKRNAERGRAIASLKAPKRPSEASFMEDAPTTRMEASEVAKQAGLAGKVPPPTPRPAQARKEKAPPVSPPLRPSGGGGGLPTWAVLLAAGFFGGVIGLLVMIVFVLLLSIAVGMS